MIMASKASGSREPERTCGVTGRVLFRSALWPSLFHGFIPGKLAEGRKAPGLASCWSSSQARSKCSLLSHFGSVSLTELLPFCEF